MNRYTLLTAACAVLILTGQGCFSGNQEATDAFGGVWQTDDSGETWIATNALPQSVSIGSISGVNVLDFEMDPSDTTAYYISTQANGMFYSYDAAASWQRPEDLRVKAGAVYDIEVDPRNVCTLYAVTNHELLKSTDCSRTFETVYTETRTNELLTTITIDWFAPETLWLGTSAGDAFKSLDAGQTWARQARFGSQVNFIEVSNADSRIIMVGTQGKSFFRSEDSGDNWVIFEDTLEQFDGIEEASQLAQTADGNSVMVLVESGILISGDKGETWDRLDLVTARGQVKVWSMAFHPHDDHLISYATENTFYQSTSRGDAWLTQDMPSSRVANVMFMHPDVPNRVIVGFLAVEED
jgi:photosystem II stability/assembly factor-like uncharacterized protein